jgi:quercetin dioxygenase-like cupin family protein
MTLNQPASGEVMATETIVKQANQLKVGDIIVAPGGEWHRVVGVDHHDLAGAWLTCRTDLH